MSAGGETVVPRHHRPTPAEIVSWLPKSATPAQQDSAIQAHIKPCEIHWSERPDTLHLPGHSKGKSVFDFSIPQYYRQSFFSEKEYFHPEIVGGRRGVAGDPVPYSIASDNFMSLLLLVSFVVTIFAITQSREFIVRQVKSLFYIQRGNVSGVSETSVEVRFQLVLGLMSCMLFSVLYFFYLSNRTTEAFTIEQSQIIVLFTGVFSAYFLLKELLYLLVNRTFFDAKKSQQWNYSFLFFTAMEGVGILPLVFLQSFFFIQLKTMMIYFVSVLILFKILYFYKEMQIFFTRKGRYLQIFLYFCTLEIVPLSILWSILDIISEYIKVNY